MNFFNKLPTINYNGNIARNIMARAKLSDSAKANSRLFYPYTTSGEERVDNLSQQYYGSPGYTWLIWFANETIDPYYGMALNEYDLEQYIITKYGSTSLAQRKISHYKVNWSDASSGITVDLYNSLNNGDQKYWEPILDYNLNVRGYRRKQEDQILNTNRVGALNIVANTAAFKIGEEVCDINNSAIYGFITYSDDTSITAQHLQGNFNAGSIVIGKESGAQATVTFANNFVATTSAFTEAKYWSPVTYYEYEVEENEKKKEIQLVDAMQKNIAEQELIRVMSAS
jgi:hypothetical protein